MAGLSGSMARDVCAGHSDDEEEVMGEEGGAVGGEPSRVYLLACHAPKVTCWVSALQL